MSKLGKRVPYDLIRSHLIRVQICLSSRIGTIFYKMWNPFDQLTRFLEKKLRITLGNEKLVNSKKI